MGPNKKKKKPTSNPSRGFATVSTPSKKADQSPPEAKDSPELPSNDGKPADAERAPSSQVNVEYGATDLQQMSPEELERHLEEAELQSLLDAYGQQARKDVGRQITRLKTERRSLRRGGMMLETASWLPQAQHEILELARTSYQDLNTIKAVEERLSDKDLCIKLWIVHQILESLQFRKLENVLRHLVKTSFLIAHPASNSVAWGLDEAMSWLALYADPEDLPAFQIHGLRYTTSTSPSRSPSSLFASGETIDASRPQMILLYICLPPLDNSGSGACSPRPESPAKHEASVTNTTTIVSDESDDNDPEQLTENFIRAKLELLKSSMSGNGNEQEQQTDQQQGRRLKQRIQKIERDILFDRSDAMAQWDEVRKNLEIDHARSGALTTRQNSRGKTSSSPNCITAKGDIEEKQSTISEDAIEEGLFDELFESNESNALDGDQSAAITITVRDFGPLGAGANPRNILEDICKTK
jgi:ATP-dependent RNA helicase DHX29